MSLGLSDLGNAERFMVRAASRGACWLRQFKRTLRGVGQRKQPSWIECENYRPNIVAGDVQQSHAILTVRTHEDIFNDYKVHLRQFMVANGASADSVAEFDGVEWGQDDGPSTNNHSNAVGVCADVDVVELTNSHNVSLSDGSAEALSGTRAGGASSPARQVSPNDKPLS